MPAIETDPLTITLPRHDLGQIIDGLCCRQEAYRKTAEYHEPGGSSGACARRPRRCGIWVRARRLRQ